FGNSRVITGQKLINLWFSKSEVDICEVIQELGQRFPALDGKVLDTGTKSLLSSYALNLNGVGFKDAAQIELADGDSILILPSQAGG
ncbi:MAG: hypothetical protein VX692_00545, partial [Chloroflexota bacterium]|nr:hypothetical protein [Chloroflexota bacterium]